MRRSYDYEFKQESHSVHEKRTCWGTTYPSYEEYHVPPPTMDKMVSHHPSYHYEPPSDDDNDHHHDHTAVNDSRWNHHDDDLGNRGWYGTRHANNHAEVKKNKYLGGILRPPLGSVSRLPSQHHQQHEGVDQGHDVKSQNAWRYGGASRNNHNNNNNNNNLVFMEDYFRKYPNYGEVLRLEDGYDHVGIGGEELESLIKGMQGVGMVKKIEVIEYEKKTYRGARQEWRVLGGSGAPNNYNSTNNHYLANSYPNTKAPWVKGF